MSDYFSFDLILIRSCLSAALSSLQATITKLPKSLFSGACGYCGVEIARPKLQWSRSGVWHDCVGFLLAVAAVILGNLKAKHKNPSTSITSNITVCCSEFVLLFNWIPV